MTKTTRIFIAPSRFSISGVSLAKTELHYLRKVLRKREGDLFAALDGQGRAWLCRLGAGAEAVRVDDYPAHPPLLPSLTAGIALCKGSRFESALEKLAELGVHRVVPMFTERTERKAPSDDKLLRWREISRSASALAGRLIPMEVAPPSSLQQMLEAPASHLVYCHPGGTAASELFRPIQADLTVLIGPEGGFSPEEVGRLEQRGRALGLGPYNLRVETAAVTAAALAFNLSSQECEAPAATNTP